MDTTQPTNFMQAFQSSIAGASSPAEAWRALHRLADALVGAKLFTVTTVDMKLGEARRLYTSDAVNYPVAGSKPVLIDPWYEQVVLRQEDFVANTLDEIARHFPDHALIGSLGCGSVVNVPVVLRGEVVATINCLDAERYFTPERVATARQLVIPALLCLLLERSALAAN